MNKYYVTVYTYADATQMGKRLAFMAKNEYDRTIMTAEQFAQIVERLADEMEDLLVSNRRLKRLKIGTSGFIPAVRPHKLREEIEYALIYFESPKSGNVGKRAFQISGVLVNRDFTREGGEA